LTVRRPGSNEHRAVLGRVTEILVAAGADDPMQELQRGTVTTDGLDGDRYSLGIGTYSASSDRRGRAMTLIESEVLEDVGLTGSQARRNLVTQGVRLNDLVGIEFRVGEIVCRGARLCEPCLRLEERTGVTVRAFVHRGGLNADVLVGGEIRVGDRIELDTR
jgi:hypothetical protein